MDYTRNSDLFHEEKVARDLAFSVYCSLSLILLICRLLPHSQTLFGNGRGDFGPGSFQPRICKPTYAILQHVDLSFAPKEIRVVIVSDKEDFMENGLEAISVTKKTGDEPIHKDGQPIGHTLLSFWQWYVSDILSNATRGVLAEYLVACDLGMTNFVIPSDSEESPFKVALRSILRGISPRNDRSPAGIKTGKTAWFKNFVNRFTNFRLISATVVGARHRGRGVFSRL